MIRLIFKNADATPKTQVIECSAESVAPIMRWYASHHAGDRYKAAFDGRNVPMDQNGEPILPLDDLGDDMGGAEVIIRLMCSDWENSLIPPPPKKRR